MVHEMTGDLLSCDADYICHQTNFYGVMGAGVAASIHSKLLSPAAYSVYHGFAARWGAICWARCSTFRALPKSREDGRTSCSTCSVRMIGRGQIEA